MSTPAAPPVSHEHVRRVKPRDRPSVFTAPVNQGAPSPSGGLSGPGLEPEPGFIRHKPVEEWVGAVCGHGPGVLGHGGGDGVGAAILIHTGGQLVP